MLVHRMSYAKRQGHDVANIPEITRRETETEARSLFSLVTALPKLSNG